MANIIVPERGKIEVGNGSNGYSRRDFLGLAGRLGAGILAAGVGLTALDGLVGSEENAVYAKEEKGKKTAKLKWKDYRTPEKATITYDPETDRTLSKEFIEWDMKGYGSPILKEEPDLPGKILEIGGELKIDPAVIVAYFRTKISYGRDPSIQGIRSPWRLNVSKNTPEEQKYKSPNGEFVMFPSWGDGTKACWGSSGPHTDLWEKFPDFKKSLCTTITQMQMLDEMLDKKTKEGKEYDPKLWKPMWDAVKKKVK